MWKYITAGLIFLAVILVAGGTEPLSPPIDEYHRTPDTQDATVQDLVIADENEPSHTPLYDVVRVVDGDTVDVSIDGKIERLRLIGINTPETVDPRKPVECFGREASNKAKELLDGKRVALEKDPSQGERDKYARLLRYVFLENGTNFNLKMIEEGYAYEYTYDGEYKYQKEFQDAQRTASASKIGLWGAGCGSEVAPTYSAPVLETNACNIKGNISSGKEKIYHLPHCGSYDKTVIDESAGEKWFCSESDAVNSGWRKAKNC